MKPRKLFEEYLKLSDRDKIIFDVAHNKFKKVQEEENYNRRMEIIETFKNINENGVALYDTDWLIKNYIK